MTPHGHSHAPGYPRIDIVLAQESSAVGFDPKEVYISVFTALEWTHAHLVDHLRIAHPWHGQCSFDVVPGVLVVNGRRGKKLEVLTFGGSLQIEPGESFTPCTVESPAPIFEIGTANHTLLTLVEEVEIILAHRRAAWGQKGDEFESRLAKVLAGLLVIACLDHILKQIERSRRDVLEVQEVIPLIVEERHRREDEGKWPGQVSAITDLSQLRMIFKRFNDVRKGGVTPCLVLNPESF